MDRVGYMKRYWQRTIFRHGVASLIIGNYTGLKRFIKAYRLIGAYFIWIGLSGYEVKITIPRLIRRKG